jgi:hypothetical protein
VARILVGLRSQLRILEAEAAAAPADDRGRLIEYLGGMPDGAVGGTIDELRDVLKPGGGPGPAAGGGGPEPD